MTRNYYLNPKTPVIDVAEWPGLGGLNLFIFSDRQLCILQSLLFPYVRWRTRFARPLGGNLYETVSDEVWAELLPEADDLELQLWSGKMDISDLVSALTALANAIEAQKPSSLSCGVGEPLTAMQGCLDQYDPTDFIPPNAEPEPDPGGPPPEGFDTWEAYYDYKCKASHSVFLLLRKTASMLSTFDSPIAHVAVVTAGIGALAIFLPAAFTPPGIAAMAAAIIAFNIISYVAAEHCDQIVSYLDTHKDAIICDLYNSGDAAAALEAVSNWLEDAIQAIEWGEILGPLAPELNAALGAIFSQVENNGTVNVLFRLTEDVLLPEVTCECGGPSGWHFTYNAERWAWYEDPRNTVYANAGWESSPSPQDPDDDPGCLAAILDLPEGEYQYWEGSWRFSGLYLASNIAHTGDTFAAHGYKSSTAGNVKILIRIVYSDETQDYALYDNAYWQPMAVAVDEANDGKTISHLCLTISPDSVDRNPVTWYFDHASWTVSE
jgi:hypothetical protein